MVFCCILLLLLIWLHQVLVAAWGGLVPWLGMEPEPTALGAQSLSHWTIMEVRNFAVF